MKRDHFCLNSGSSLLLCPHPISSTNGPFVYLCFFVKRRPGCGCRAAAGRRKGLNCGLISEWRGCQPSCQEARKGSLLHRLCLCLALSCSECGRLGWQASWPAGRRLLGPPGEVSPLSPPPVVFLVWQPRGLGRAGSTELHCCIPWLCSRGREAGYLAEGWWWCLGLRFSFGKAPWAGAALGMLGRLLCLSQGCAGRFPSSSSCWWQPLILGLSFGALF